MEPVTNTPGDTDVASTGPGVRNEKEGVRARPPVPMKTTYQPTGGANWASGANGASRALLVSSYNKHVRASMDAVDKVAALGLGNSGLDLPRIVVIGDQSVGKTSVLEQLSDVQLPRGTSLVTRVPLMMRMRTAKSDIDWKCTISYKDINDTPVEKQFVSPADVDNEVRQAQKLITGNETDLKDSLITLDIYSKTAPNLTLIDLPGIIRYDADNPNIEKNISRMIESYIAPTNTLILAVFPATSDSETVGVFRLAKNVDPKLERTFGIMTKLDCVSPGSEKDVIATLNNKRIKLNKPMIALKCRNQEDLNRGMTLDEAIRSEQDYIRNHEVYSQLQSSQYGIQQLSETLVMELAAHIKGVVPGLLQQISKSIRHTKDLLRELGTHVSTDSEEKRRELLKLLAEFTDAFVHVAMGHFEEHPSAPRLYTMWADASRKYADIIVEITNAGLSQDLANLQGILETVMRNRGDRLLSFAENFPACKEIILSLVERFMEPSKVYLSEVCQHVEEVLRQLASDILSRYPKLYTEVKELADEQQQLALTLVEDDLRKRFQMEQFVWCQDMTYITELDTIMKEAEAITLTVAAEEEKLMGWNKCVKGVLDGTKAYMKVANRRIMDTIPQSVLFFMLTQLSKEIKKYVLVLAVRDDVDALFEEEISIAQERSKLETELRSWREAEKALNAL